MSRKELILCVGMHRSGTSLTTSLLESLGVCLPGELIEADAANPSGYYENQSIVSAQEQLLKDLGYWWPTERASRGMPESVVKKQVYKDYVKWLTGDLEKLLNGSQNQIAIKDPRTSLLIPAWKQAAHKLGLSLRIVICIREPRDVCWSLVCRDGDSVGMTWSRAQRLWMEHYKSLLRDLKDEKAIVIRYESWLNPHIARKQLNSLANFIGVACTHEQQNIVLNRIRPDFNHGGLDNVPKTHKSLRRLHNKLIKSGILPADLAGQASRCALALEINRLARAFRERVHVGWIQTGWTNQSLKAALDRKIIKEQIGSVSIREYIRRFPEESDLRPHPLISPAHLNQERTRRGLPPIRSAGELFRHLLYPDLLPLDTHPWFNCREYEIQTGQLGKNQAHPILNYLRNKTEKKTSKNAESTFKEPWLIRLGAHLDRENEENLPEVIKRIHPGLVLADPMAKLGNPSEGRKQLIANERYLKDIRELFEQWTDSNPDGPINWLDKQPNVGELGLTAIKPAKGYQLWWISGHWEAILLGEIAGIDIDQALEFNNPQELFAELSSMTSEKSIINKAIIVALTQPLLELFLSEKLNVPENLAFLNLVWPRPTQQSAWLHLLAQGTMVVECRKTVRAFLQGLGFESLWPSNVINYQESPNQDAPTLLLALESGEAEAQLASAAQELNADRYNAILRLDAELQQQDPLKWLEKQFNSHGRWLWLNPLSPASNPKGHAVVAWAIQRGANLKFLSDEPATKWWDEFTT